MVCPQRISPWLVQYAKIRLPLGLSLTCRRRHVKCDEAKPACGGCAKIKQACVYANPAARRSSEPTAATLTFTTESDYNLDAVSTAPAPADHVGVGVGVAEPEMRGLDTDATQGVSPIITHGNVHATVYGWLSSHRAGKQAAHMDNTDALGSPPTNFSIRSPEAEMGSRFAQRLLSNTSEQPHLYDLTAEDLACAGSIWSSGSNIETATARWLGLLINDAAHDDGLLPSVDFDSTGFDIFGNSLVHTPASEQVGQKHFSQQAREPLPTTTNPFLRERITRLGGAQVCEKEAWHSAEYLELLPHEHIIFQNFVQHISLWVSRSSMTHFTLV